MTKATKSNPAAAPEAGSMPKRGARGRPAFNAEAQRQKILEAAVRLFIENGFSGTTLEAVGKAARVTKRSIYLHIGDKAELFRAVCMERLPLADRLRFDIPLDGRTLREIIVAMAREILRHAFAPDAIALERALTIESMRFPELVQEVIEAGMRRVNGNIAEMFEALVSYGLPPADFARTADIFYDVVIGNRMFRMTMGHGELPPDEDELAQRIDMFIHGHLMRLPGKPGG